jgi:hypothetical protein
VHALLLQLSTVPTFVTADLAVLDAGRAHCKSYVTCCIETLAAASRMHCVVAHGAVDTLQYGLADYVINACCNVILIRAWCDTVMKASAGANMHTLLEIMQQGLLQARSSPGKQATRTYRKYNCSVAIVYCRVGSTSMCVLQFNH